MDDPSVPGAFPSAGSDAGTDADAEEPGLRVFWDQFEDLFPLAPPHSAVSGLHGAAEAQDSVGFDVEHGVEHDVEDGAGHHTEDRDPVSRRNIDATLGVLCELLDQNGGGSAVVTGAGADILAERIGASFFCQLKWHRVVDAMVTAICRDRLSGPALLTITSTLLHLAEMDHRVYRRMSKCPDPQLIFSLVVAIWPAPAHFLPSSDHSQSNIRQQEQDRDALPTPPPSGQQQQAAVVSVEAEGLATAQGRQHDKNWNWPTPLPPSSETAGGDALPEATTIEGQTAVINAELRLKAIQLFYLLCKVKLMHPAQLSVISPSFINHLFDLVEETRDNEDETFNFHVILLLLALNEQFMVASLADNQSAFPSHGSTSSGHSGTSNASHQKRKSSIDRGNTIRPRPNLVINVLRLRLHTSKTFSENIIFMLNRTSHDVEEDMCIQLLILKLLYVLFTTPDLALFFYTNDLKVLLDIFIREIQDLPEERETLRHTYLRVLHPLMLNSQLRANSYKQPEIRALLLRILAQSQFREVDPATIRLCNRCLTSEWCVLLANTLEQSEPYAMPGTDQKRGMKAAVSSDNLPPAPHWTTGASFSSEPSAEARSALHSHVQAQTEPHAFPLPDKTGVVPELSDPQAVHRVQAFVQVVREQANSRGDLDEEHNVLSRAHEQVEAAAEKVAHAELHHPGADNHSSPSSTAFGMPGGSPHLPLISPSQDSPRLLRPHEGGASEEGVLGGGRARAVSTSGIHPSDPLFSSPPSAPEIQESEKQQASQLYDSRADPLAQVVPAPAGAGLSREGSLLSRHGSTLRRRASISSLPGGEEKPGLTRRMSRRALLTGDQEKPQALTRPATPDQSELESRGNVRGINEHPCNHASDSPCKSSGQGHALVEGQSALPAPVPAHVVPGMNSNMGGFGTDPRAASPFPESVFFPPTPPMDARAVRGRRAPPAPASAAICSGSGSGLTAGTSQRGLPPPVKRENKPRSSLGGLKVVPEQDNFYRQQGHAQGHVHLEEQGRSANPSSVTLPALVTTPPAVSATRTAARPPRPPQTTKPSKHFHRPPPAPPITAARGPHEWSSVAVGPGVAIVSEPSRGPAQMTDYQPLARPEEPQDFATRAAPSNEEWDEKSPTLLATSNASGGTESQMGLAASLGVVDLVNSPLSPITSVCTSTGISGGTASIEESFYDPAATSAARASSILSSSTSSSIPASIPAPGPTSIPVQTPLPIPTSALHAPVSADRWIPHSTQTPTRRKAPSPPREASLPRSSVGSEQYSNGLAEPVVPLRRRPPPPPPARV